MTAGHKQTNLKGLWENSRIIFQNSRSTQKCAWWNVLYVQPIENDSHQCRHLTEWTTVQYYSTIWQLILSFLYVLSFIRIHTTCNRLNFPRHCHAGIGGGGSKCIVPLILNLGTRWSWVVEFTPWLLYSLGKSPTTHQTGRWVCLRLDILKKRKISHPHQDWNPGPFSCKELLHPLYYSGSLTSMGTTYYYIHSQKSDH